MKSMAQVFIGLGSNLGGRLNYLKQALTEMAHLPSTAVITCSSVYETDPVGVKEQPIFLNVVAELDSTLIPYELFTGLKRIEREIGRTRSERWGPREIDLDLLYYGREVVNDQGLHVPHPEIANRRFVLVPMKEIAPAYFDPLRHLSIEELLHRCTDTSAVRKSAQQGSLCAKE